MQDILKQFYNSCPRSWRAVGAHDLPGGGGEDEKFLQLGLVIKGFSPFICAMVKSRVFFGDGRPGPTFNDGILIIGI